MPSRPPPSVIVEQSVPRAPAAPRVVPRPPVAAHPFSVPPSFQPTTESVAPVAFAATARSRGQGALVALAATLALGVLGAVLLLAFPERASAVFGADTGALVVSVTDETGDPIDRVEVYTDGALQCTEAPCRIDSLSAGAHVVAARASGFESLAPRAVTVPSDAESNVQLRLSAVAEDTVPSKATEAAAEATTLDELAEPVKARPAARAPLRKVAAASPAPGGAAAAPASTPVPARPPEKATLTLSSNVASNVIVDGRPVGPAPKSVRLPAGTHTVVFATADGQRTVRTVTVKEGQSLAVGARFDD